MTDTDLTPVPLAGGGFTLAREGTPFLSTGGDPCLVASWGFVTFRGGPIHHWSETGTTVSTFLVPDPNPPVRVGEAETPRQATPEASPVSPKPVDDEFGPQAVAIRCVIEQAKNLTNDQAEALDAARGAARDAAWGAARGAACALVVADLVGQHGLKQRHIDTLLAPWVSVMGDPREVTA